MVASSRPCISIRCRKQRIDLRAAEKADQLARECVGAKRVRCRDQARGPLGVRHHRFKLFQRPRQPGRQKVRQQAERGMALGAVPASDADPARGLARIGAVACERTSPVRVVRTARKTCIAPRPGSNVLLAGVPRWVSKLHRPWPGGGLQVCDMDLSRAARGGHDGEDSSTSHELGRAYPEGVEAHPARDGVRVQYRWP